MNKDRSINNCRIVANRSAIKALDRGAIHDIYCSVGPKTQVAALILLVVLGCGKPNPLGRKAITGEVIFDGSLLESGLIELSPNDPNGVSTGSAIQDGEYRIEAHQGVPPGQYTVRITSPIDDAAVEDEDELLPPGPQGGGPRQPPPATERIPAEYNMNSDKVVRVTEEGPNRFDFNIPASTSR